jgi:hypothetical protein
MTGGDSLTEDLNLFYNAGDIAWMITATALVLLMIPGVGYAYIGFRVFADANVLQLLLLWPRPSEVRTVTHLALGCCHSLDLLPMVLLGLLPHLFSHGRQIHW